MKGSREGAEGESEGDRGGRAGREEMEEDTGTRGRERRVIE